MQRILLIEDDKIIRTVIALYLRVRGHEVEVAEDGEEGIELFTRVGNFDLVITDIRMPRKGGNDVAKHIRGSDRAETPVVAITAYKDEVERDLFNFTVIKPFRNEDLTKIIGSLDFANSREAVEVPEAVRQAKTESFSPLQKS